MLIQPKPEIVALAEAVHGGMDISELSSLGMDLNSVFDFSANVNPFGPSPRVLELAGTIAWNRYPDRESVELRRVLARSLGCSEEQLIAGNGSGELLWLVALVYLRPNDSVLIVGPTYSEYSRCAVAMGAQCRSCNATVENDFEVPVEAITESLRADQPRMIFICNPNNPTGQWLASGIIEKWAHEFARTLFVVDEAYIEFASGASSLIGSKCRNLVVLRSFSKAYGLAGLRLGYALAAPEIIGALRSVRVPWCVNAAAQAMASVAIEDTEFLEKSLSQLRESKRTLVSALESLGLNPLPSSTHFFMIPVVDAARTRVRLMESGILVRDCSSFGLPGYIRIATRSGDDNARLLDALANQQIVSNIDVTK
jgi:histidinol-phosphate aminotransferase